MTIRASAVLNFESALRRAYKITTSPSSPVPGDAVLVTILAAQPWQLHSPYGGLGPRTTSPAQIHEEVVSISESLDVSTSAPVASLIQATVQTPLVNTEARTVVESAGSVVTPRLSVVNGRLVIDAESLVGSIRVKYNGFSAQHWTHEGFPAPGDYILFARDSTEGDWEPVTITVGDPDAVEGSQPSIVTIQAKDFCTDLPVPGASVYLEGVYKGTTDINGKLVVGLLNPRSYGVRIEASGYTPTDSDDLANDSFTI